MAWFGAGGVFARLGPPRQSEPATPPPEGNFQKGFQAPSRGEVPAGRGGLAPRLGSDYYTSSQCTVAGCLEKELAGKVIFFFR